MTKDNFETLLDNGRSPFDCFKVSDMPENKIILNVQTRSQLMVQKFG